MTEPATWRPDPIGEASWRWWDGNDWTGQVAPARQAPELAPLASVVGRSLKLDQQQGAGTDVLQCDGVPVGLMYKPWAGELTGETSSGTWLFDRQGVVTGRARVLVQPSSQEIGMFAWDGIGTGTDGTLHFVDGRWFRLTRAAQLAAEQVASPAAYDPSHAVWVWYGPDRAPLMTVRLSSPPPKTKKVFGKEITYTTSSYGTGKTGMDIWTDLHPAAAGVRELPLVTLLGTFLVWWTTTMKESVRRRNRWN
jgi:hypothetical protein